MHHLRWPGLLQKRYILRLSKIGLMRSWTFSRSWKSYVSKVWPTIVRVRKLRSPSRWRNRIQSHISPSYFYKSSQLPVNIIDMTMNDNNPKLFNQIAFCDFQWHHQFFSRSYFFRVWLLLNHPSHFWCLWVQMKGTMTLFLQWH